MRSNFVAGRWGVWSDNEVILCSRQVRAFGVIMRSYFVVDSDMFGVIMRS